MPDAHDDLRPLLFSIAYRMLGSVVEAEDMVQESPRASASTTCAPPGCAARATSGRGCRSRS